MPRFQPGNQAAKKSGARSARALKRQAGFEARRLKGWLGDVPAAKQPLVVLASTYLAKVSMITRWLYDHGGPAEPRNSNQSQDLDDATRLLLAVLDRLGNEHGDELESLLRGGQR